MRIKFGETHITRLGLQYGDPCGFRWKIEREKNDSTYFEYKSTHLGVSEVRFLGRVQVTQSRRRRGWVGWGPERSAKGAGGRRARRRRASKVTRAKRGGVRSHRVRRRRAPGRPRATPTALRRSCWRSLDEGRRVVLAPPPPCSVYFRKWETLRKILCFVWKDSEDCRMTLRPLYRRRGQARSRWQQATRGRGTRARAPQHTST